MPEQDRELASVLHRLGAVELADHVWNGTCVAPSDFDRARGELDAALAAAREAGDHAVLAAGMRRAMGAGGVVGATVAALLHGDRDRLPAPAPAPGPAPAPARVPVVGTAPPPPPPPSAPVEADAFAVTLPALREPGPSAALPVAPPEPAEGYAWGAVAVAVVGALCLFWAPLDLLVVIAPLLSAVTVALLLVDRAALRDAGHRRVPGWGWALVPPAYLLRRGHALGVKPLHGYALLGLGMATRLGIVVFGIGGGQLANMEALEAQLEAEYSQMWGQPATADCPQRIALERGVEFECVVLREGDDGRSEFGFQMVDDRGGLRMTHSSYTGGSRPTTTYGVAP